MLSRDSSHTFGWLLGLILFVTAQPTTNKNSLGSNNIPKCLNPIIITSVHVSYIPHYNSIHIRCGTIGVSHCCWPSTRSTTDIVRILQRMCWESGTQLLGCHIIVDLVFSPLLIVGILQRMCWESGTHPDTRFYKSATRTSIAICFGTA